MYCSAHQFIDEPNDQDIVFSFNDQSIYLSRDEKFLQFGQLQISKAVHYYCFAKMMDKRCLLVPHDAIFNANKLQLLPLKKAWAHFDEAQRALSGLATQLNHWRLTHQYCGQCGNQLVEKMDERARLCQRCGRVIYPKICPCVIVVIKKGKQLLLARSKHFPEGVYSALAGFVEAGETIEQAVHREVMEEVGIKITNLKYVASQPWPFPNSLMLGFTADYASGDIVIDEHEIEDAQWFHTNKLPELPSKMSIARALIEGCLF